MRLERKRIETKPMNSESRVVTEREKEKEREGGERKREVKRGERANEKKSKKESMDGEELRISRE